MINKLRVVIDPNIVASVLLGGRTRNHFLTLVNLTDKIDICYADELLTEIENLPQHRYFRAQGISEAVVLDFLKFFTGLGLKIFITSTVKLGRDKNDFYLLSLCRDARANYLLTGDPDLLILTTYGQTRIMRMADFVRELPELLKTYRSNPVSYFGQNQEVVTLFRSRLLDSGYFVYPFFCSFAQPSFNVTVRLKTGLPCVESGSKMK